MEENSKNLNLFDPQIAKAIEDEKRRQQDKLILIASENYVSKAVLEAQGSVLTNKYAEGYPGQRYYGGCEYVDTIEELARIRATDLFGVEHANVQPHAGALANLAVYVSVLRAGDSVLGMDRAHGGHLTHGSPVNISGRYYEFHSYGVDPQTEKIDYDELLETAKRVRPKLIVAGASAYPRIVHFDKMKEVADEVGALLMSDMAHIAGLVAAGVHPNPVPHSDFVTSTTHKTLRGPRGGIILCKNEYARKIDQAVFPGIQSGPLMHTISAKAVAFKEALEPSFKGYQKQVISNAKALGDELQHEGLRLVTGGTDNHMVLVDLTSRGVTGKEAEENLDLVNITINKNTIPNDKQKAFIASGIRIGTPALTTRGLKEREMRIIARCISKAISTKSEKERNEIRQTVDEISKNFPLYKALRQTAMCV